MAFEPEAIVPSEETQACLTCKWWNAYEFNPPVCQYMPRVWAGDAWQFPHVKETDRCHNWETK